MNSPGLSGNHQEKTALAYQGTIRKMNHQENKQFCTIREMNSPE
jgi:hypothetical protein